MSFLLMLQANWEAVCLIFMYFHVVIKCPDFAHIIVFTNQMLFVHEFLSRLILFFHYEAEVLTRDRYFDDYLYV